MFREGFRVWGCQGVQVSSSLHSSTEGGGGELRTSERVASSRRKAKP